jgi:dihydrolipoamide dehydrogenase
LGQLGHDVTLVEKDAYGGACLNRGCIPSKALITASDLAERAKSAQQMGIDADVSTDFERMVEWKDEIVGRLTGGVEQLCRTNGVDLIDGRAAFVDESQVRIEGAGADAADRIRFGTAIIATGSRPMALPEFNFGEEFIMSSTDALAAAEIPDRMLTIGGGYIGMELSTVFAKLGCDVTVVEMLDSVLPTYEDDLSAVVRRRAEDLGVDFDFGTAATDWTEIKSGVLVTTETEDGDSAEYETDRVLVAIGREPVTDTLDLSNAGVDTTKRGFIDTDKNGRTEQENIYAIGDVAGDPLLAHAANKEGILAAQDIAGEPLDVGDWIVPEAVFTDPEIAAVGMTQSEAEEIGFEPVVGTMPFDASGRAMTLGETDGFVRIVASSDGGALLGAQIVGPDASELVAELTFAIKHRASLTDIAETIHVHPTLSEAVMEAAENAMGQAIHTTN